jgi:hypothetical protein
MSQQAHTSKNTQIITILSSPEKVYAFCRKPKNMSKIGKDFDGGRIIDDRPNKLISWTERESNSETPTGVLEFERDRGHKGTVVRLTMSNAATARENLRRIKAFLEAGEVPTVEGQPTGRDEDLANDMKEAQ